MELTYEIADDVLRIIEGDIVHEVDVYAWWCNMKIVTHKQIDSFTALSTPSEDDLAYIKGYKRAGLRLDDLAVIDRPVYVGEDPKWKKLHFSYCKLGNANKSIMYGPNVTKTMIATGLFAESRIGAKGHDQRVVGE
jgi:hypothetical protein